MSKNRSKKQYVKAQEIPLRATNKKTAPNKLLSKYSHRSLDSKWEKIANLCLFSYVDDDGNEVFVSTEEERDYFGKGHEETFRSYPVFAPDEIVHRIAGKVGKAKNRKEVLTAWIDGSYSYSNEHGCCAYSVFFQVGDRIAEYANTVYDKAARYGATASELMAAIVAIKIAIAFGYSKIDLRHDYTGVAFFSDDAQVEPNKRSKMYWIFAQYNAFLQCAREFIDITYTKVKSHDLDVGNEHADFLARVYSKKGRREIDQHIRRRSQEEALSSPQIDAFAERHNIGTLSFCIIEDDWEERDMRGHFGFDEVEYAAIVKMFHEKSTSEMTAEMLLDKRSLAELRRRITVKLGMPADAASDNTIVKKILEWLYL